MLDRKEVDSISARQRALVLILFSLLLLSFTAILAFSRPFRPDAETGGVAEAGPSPAPLPGERVTFLVMGVDKRQDDTGRSDSMMVVSLDQGQQQVSILSLPRDTWTQIPGHGYDKLNHAYAFGGDQLAVATVQGLLGIPIDHFVTISFDGFARIIDALGGIEIDAEKRMYYVDPFDTGMGPDGLVIDIQPGPQHMDGTTALKYARYRMDEEGDLGRMRRQQQVAQAMMKAAARPSVITRIPQLIGALNDALDTDLSVAEMVRLATSAKGALSRSLETASLGGTEKNIGGIYYLIPDLPAERSAAYELLVGSAPPEQYLTRAQEEQMTYAKALAEAEAAAAAEMAASQEETGGATEDPTEPETQPSQPPDGAKPPSQESGSKPVPKPKPKPQPITISVMDGSGRDLAAEYLPKLRDAGFRVGRTGTLARPVSRTVVLDHAGRSDTAERIHSVLPGALIIPDPDPKAEMAVEIILGTDLAKP